MRRTSLVVLALAATVLAVTLLPAAAANRDTGAAAEYAKPGFQVALEDGRLWVFREGSQELQGFLDHGEPAKQVVRPGAGPGGITVKSADAETVTEYLLTRPGFWVKLEDGRLWVFREGSQELQGFLEHGEPAKQVVRPGGGPDGVTIKAVDGEVIDAYMAAGG